MSIFWFPSETWSHYIAQFGLELSILLRQHLVCTIHKCAPTHLAPGSYENTKQTHLLYLYVMLENIQSATCH